MKCIFITGATAGIGKELVRQYQSKDTKVIFCGRRKEQLVSLENELNQIIPHSVKGFQIDVSKPKDFEALAQWLIENELEIDTIIANAGFGITGTFENHSHSDYQRQFDVNVWGVLHTIRPFLSMIKKNKGKIAIIGSGNSYIALPTASAYCMSKFAIKAFADSLRAELHSSKVSVTLVCPGFIETEIRHINNAGKLIPDSKDPVPGWLQMSAKKAAKQIKHAVECRRSEVWITQHVKLFILIEKYFTGLFRVLKNHLKI
jgi:short-subunit dehydrogenase